MCAARLYAAHAAGVEVRRVDNRFVIDLGRGEREAPRDVRVATLARRLFKEVAPLSPEAIYEYAMHGDHSYVDALKRPLRTTLEDVPCVEWTRGDHHLRVHTATLARLPYSLVRHYRGFEEACTFGYAPRTLSFETEEAARLAGAVDAYHTRAGADEVLQYLSHAVDTPCLLHRPLNKSETLPRPEADTVVSAMDDLSRIRHSHWRRLCEEVRLEEEEGATPIARPTFRW